MGQATTIIETPNSTEGKEWQQQLLKRLLIWREKHITDRQMTIILAFAIGFCLCSAFYH